MRSIKSIIVVVQKTWLNQPQKNSKEFRTKKTYSIYRVQMVGELLKFKEKNTACKFFLDHNLRPNKG